MQITGSPGRRALAATSQLAGIEMPG